MIIAVCGLPGSGKSFFGERLADRIGAAYLSSDRMRKSLISDPHYTRDEKDKVYESLFANVTNLVEEGNHVIFDATFHKRDRREQLLNFSAVAPVTFIEIEAEEAITRERLSRDRSYSDADWEVYQKLKTDSEPIEFPHLKLRSTNSNIEQMLQEACDYLKPFLDEETGD